MSAESASLERQARDIVNVYHLTKMGNAAGIATNGFRNGTGTYLTRSQRAGVWVSDRPLLIESNIDPDDAVCFEVEIEEAALAAFEWFEDGKPYREWLVSAEVLNGCRRRRLPEEELLSLFR